jgi:hypothetical protein
VTDPITQKTVIVDVAPAIWQECVEDKSAEKIKASRFYWRTISN